jgi:ABC-2 type transport system ATP-binding protein
MRNAVKMLDISKNYPRAGAIRRKQILTSTRHLNLAADFHVAGQEQVVLERISFDVGEGEIFGILGQHGSGKSTLIQILAALIQPDEGEIRIFGIDSLRQPAQVQRWINRISVEASLFKQLSPLENMLRGVPLIGPGRSERGAQAEFLLTRLGLDQKMIRRPIEVLGQAVQQKVSVARALLSRPRLLLLDEPARGLDPESRGRIAELVRGLRDVHGSTVVYTSREPLELQGLCDRVVRLQGGKIHNFSPADPVSQHLKDSLEMEFQEGCQLTAKMEASIA